MNWTIVSPTLIGDSVAENQSLVHRFIPGDGCFSASLFLGGLVKIIDVESYNGTFVNGVPVGEHRLIHTLGLRTSINGG